MSARFIAGGRLVPAPPGARRVELDEELGAPRFLVRLADARGRPPQPVERAQEPTVGLALPADVAAPTPPGLAELIEPTVVADAEAGVRLDRVAGQLPEPGPPVEE